MVNRKLSHSLRRHQLALHPISRQDHRFRDPKRPDRRLVQLENGDVNPTVETDRDNPSLINTCETVDKVFYRGSDQLSLDARCFNYESSKFLQADGDILSDHNPITVNFSWSVSSTRRQSGFWGGPHGTWFNDLESLPSTPKASILSFRGGSRLDSVALTLTDGNNIHSWWHRRNSC
jgi:hypothetical protein